jgi:hypothetical protein
LKRNFAGCAICDSTWGDTWEEIDGERVFFCCGLCADQFRNLVAAIVERTGWARLDAIEIAGDRRGRTVIAHSGSNGGRYRVMFNAEGGLLQFEELDPRGPPTVPPSE